MAFALVSVALGLIGLNAPLVSAATVPAQAGTYWTPVLNADFADPAVAVVGNELHAYSTNLGFLNIQGAVSSDAGHWNPVSNLVMPQLPKFALFGFTWAPTVQQNAVGQYVMFFAALDPLDGDECIGRAISSSADGPFVDNDPGFEICQSILGGSIDPNIFTDPTTGQSYLEWKSDGNHVNLPSTLWSQPLDADFNLTGSPSALMSDDQPWQDGIVENPDMIYANGTYYLFYSGNVFDSADEAIGYATCLGPSGPCLDSTGGPVFGSEPGMIGPGGPSIFTFDGQTLMAFDAWQNGDNYLDRGYRALFMANLTFSTSGPVITPFDPATLHEGYRMLDSDGGVFTYGSDGFYGSTGAMHLSSPVVAMAKTPDNKGYWLVTKNGGIYSFGDARYFGSLTQIEHVNDVVGMASDPATGGYWIVQSDGVVTAYNAPNYGDTPGLSNIVGMAALPDGSGYYLATATGAVLPENAAYYGSDLNDLTDGTIDSITVDPATGGYWLLSSGGTVSAFDAPNFGDNGAMRLIQPDVAMVATPDGEGYWLVAGDGGIFGYGDANYLGSLGNLPGRRNTVGIVN